MRLRTATAAALPLESSKFRLSGLPETSLLSALDSFNIGVAVCDRRMRFRAVSRALAEFNNLPVEAHPGKPMHEVLDSTVIKKSQPLVERVFSMGQPLPSLRRSGRLLTRPGTDLHWLSYYFPLVDKRRRVVEVGVMVMELESSSALQGSLAPVLGPANQLAAHKGGRMFNSDARNHSEFANPLQPAGILSSREQQVLRLLAEGKSNKEISPILAISVKTVETYRSRLMLKLRAPSLIHLVHYAIRHNLVDLQA